VLNVVLRNDGVAFALAHNHPSGDLEPSQLDLYATRAVAGAAPLVGLRFLDHLIVTDSAWLNLTPSRRD
jgi:DNA repair protein RadC